MNDQFDHARAYEPSALNGGLEDGLAVLARQTLGYFDEAVDIAKAGLAGERGASANALASLNSFTDNALRTLGGITEEAKRSLEAVIDRPAIARVEVLTNDGHAETIFITPGGAPRAKIGDARVASYRSVVGRLAAVPVGTEVTIPGSGKSYELVARARLHPELGETGWDSRNTVLDRLAGKPLTVVSLRALLRRPDPDDDDLAFLDSLLKKDSDAANVFEGLRRSVLKRMGLREQPLLDQYQDEIFRLPLNSRIVILGPPGSGKTTTLIKRLGMKLDLQALEAELTLVDQSLAGRAGHGTSWLMFSPTELLRLYVKEAFARERVPASDHQMLVWDQYRSDIARNRLGLLRSGTSAGAVLRPTLQNLRDEALADPIGWFEDFEAWQRALFWRELGEQAERVVASGDPGIANLGQRLLRIVEAGAGADTGAPFEAFRALSKEVSDQATALQDAIDQNLRRAFAAQLRREPELLNELLEFVSALGDASEAVDEADPEAEDDEDEAPATGQLNRETAFVAYMQAMRAQARALVSGRKLGPTTRHGRVVSWLGSRIPPEADLRKMGADVWLVTALRRLANPLRAYLGGVLGRYRRFRRQRLAEDRWYLRAGQPADLSPLELDAVLLEVLRSGRLLLREPRLAAAINEPALQRLKSIQELLKTQILVDEATDFSPLQLACMAALADPVTDAFVACGDFNQRITAYGVRSAADLAWIHPDMDVRTIKVTYRHSRQLNAFAHRIAKLSNAGCEPAALPEHVDTEGVDPVLGLGLKGEALVAWLRDRIFEIERFTGALPSIAVLVNSEKEVPELAHALEAALSEKNIKCAACLGGQARGNDGDVRVFDVQHIKGLEFEAVFFVGVDGLAEDQPDLFDKFIYVGATRAAMYLGLTTTSDALPERLAPLGDAFGANWR